MFFPICAFVYRSSEQDRVDFGEKVENGIRKMLSLGLSQSVVRMLPGDQRAVPQFSAREITGSEVLIENRIGASVGKNPLLIIQRQPCKDVPSRPAPSCRWWPAGIAARIQVEELHAYERDGS